MPLLLLLLKRRDTYYIAAILILGFLFARARSHNKEYELALAAKPKIETKVVTKIVTKIKTVKVQGPVRVVEKIVERPGGERVIEREVFKDRTETVTVNDARREDERERSQAPSCLPHAAPRRRFLGLSSAPGEWKDSLLGRAALGFGPEAQIEIGYGYETKPKRHRLELGYRF